jgi:Xaa-Pro aminopeptidase
MNKTGTVPAEKKKGIQTVVEALPITKPPLVSEQVKEYMRGEGIDAWVSYQYSDRLRNDAMSRVFRVPEGLTNATTSVFFADGREPLVFVARIEAPKFAHFREFGTVVPCTNADEFKRLFAERVRGCKRIAMEYGNDIFVPSALVPARLKEFVQDATKAEIVPSVGVVQHAVVPLSDEALAEHKNAALKLYRIMDDCTKMIYDGAESGKPVTEHEVGEFIAKRYGELGLVTCHNAAVVAVNGHIADVHYKAAKEGSAEIRKGDVVLIDIWAKSDKPEAAYADITWMCFVGRRRDIPKRYADAFRVQAEASQMAVDCIRKAFAERKPLIPREIDAIARSHILKSGYPDYPHGTGHSLGTADVHGDGVKLNQVETFPLVPRSCYTIEPGIYAGNYGARTEINFYLDPKKGPVLTTPVQKEIVCLY